MFKVQGGDEALDVEPVTLNRAKRRLQLRVCSSLTLSCSVNSGIRVEPFELSGLERFVLVVVQLKVPVFEKPERFLTPIEMISNG